MARSSLGHGSNFNFQDTNVSFKWKISAVILTMPASRGILRSMTLASKGKSLLRTYWFLAVQTLL
jgi:hypothetical protein